MDGRRVVEEVEDLKLMVSDMKEEIAELRSDVGGLGKQVEQNKVMLDLVSGRNGCCLIM